MLNSDEMNHPAFTLPDRRTGTEYRIYVSEPDESPTGGIPAMLFMDGDDQFGAAVDAYRLARGAGEVGPILVVGIGYGASYTKPGNFRVRDYTPTRLATEPESGDGDPFLEFLASTLWPAIAKRYGVRQDLRGIAGHSLGSLLAIHAMLRQKPFFNRFLASAPALWWDDRAILCAAQRLQRTGIPLPASLFLSIGAEDTASMLADLDQFEGQLAAHPFPELKVIARRFPARNHYNVLTDAFRAGMAALFAS